MRALGRVLLSSLSFSLLQLLARGQDASPPSLGDLTRHARQQRPADGSPTPSPKSARVVRDDDPSAPANDMAQPSKPGDPGHTPVNSAASNTIPKLTAEQWKAKILAQKNLIQSTQTKIDRLNESIHFHSSNQVRWNERQREKQQEVERLQTQLEEQKKRLEAMQESARKQGYGNVVYDP